MIPSRGNTVVVDDTITIPGPTSRFRLANRDLQGHPTVR